MFIYPRTIYQWDTGVYISSPTLDAGWVHFEHSVGALNLTIDSGLLEVLTLNKEQFLDRVHYTAGTYEFRYTNTGRGQYAWCMTAPTFSVVNLADYGISVAGYPEQEDYYVFTLHSVWPVPIVNKQARIPDEMLQFYGQIKAYSYVAPTASESKTLAMDAFTVVARPKPTGYVSEATIVPTYEGLTQLITDIEALKTQLRHWDVEMSEDSGEPRGYAHFTSSGVILDLINIKGEKGDTGETGATGPTGPQGPVGPKGDKGDTGLTGATGPQGATGPRGEKGDRGNAFTYSDFTQAQLEALKVKGDKGDQGERGPQGVQGVQGPQGIQGPKGDAYTITQTDYQAIADIVKEELPASGMERYIIKLVKVSDSTYKLTTYDGADLSFNALYAVLRDVNKYVVCLYGNSKLRPQYVSTNEMMFLGVDRATESKILRMLFTPTRLTYETFRLAEYSEVQSMINSAIAGAIGGSY